MGRVGLGYCFGLFVWVRSFFLFGTLLLDNASDLVFFMLLQLLFIYLLAIMTWETDRLERVSSIGLVLSEMIVSTHQ